jgi:hypothetical protein
MVFIARQHVVFYIEIYFAFALCPTIINEIKFFQLTKIIVEKNAESDDKHRLT